MVRGLTSPPSRFYVIVAYGAMPLILGFFLWVQSLPLTDKLGGVGLPEASGLESMVTWAAVAYAVAAASTSSARAAILGSRLRSLMGSDFGRVLRLSMIPFTSAIFAMVLVFLLFGYVGYAIGSGRVASASAVDAVTAAFQAYAVATLAFPAAALASIRLRDLSRAGFQRALVLQIAGEVPALLGLVWAFLAVGNLYPA